MTLEVKKQIYWSSFYKNRQSLKTFINKRLNHTILSWIILVYNTWLISSILPQKPWLHKKNFTVKKNVIQASQLNLTLIQKKSFSVTMYNQVHDYVSVIPQNRGSYKLKPRKSIQTRNNCFRYLKLMSPLNAAICTTISYTLWVEWYYLKNNYLTLRSKVKIPRRSLRYATHRLIVMHPHTKYHSSISKNKNVMARTRKYYLKNIIWPWGQRSRSMKVITVCDTPSYGHAPTYQI
jgi:hypothetical protein